MFKRKHSIKDKLVMYLVFLSVTAIFVVSYFSYLMAKDALMERSFSQLTSVKVVKNRQLHNFFQNRINDINIVKNTILKLNDNSKYHLQYHSKEFVSDFLKSNRSIYKNAFFMQDSIIFSFRNLSENHTNIIDNLDTAYINDNGLVIYYTDFIINNSNDKVSFFMGAKLYSDTEMFVFFEISSAVINKMMLEDSDNNGLGNSGESYLVGDDYLMRSSSKFQKNSILHTEVNTTGVNRVKQEESGEDIFVDYRKIEVLSSYIKADIPLFEWALMVELDKKEALAPVIAIRNYIIFVTIFISLIVLIIAMFISQKFSKPIIRLKEATSEIASGNMDIQLQQTTSDEIGDLTVAFNSMTNILKAKNQQLESEKSLRYSLILDAQEKERERLSRELHDGLGQLFTAIKLNLENYKESDTKNQESINKSIANVDNAIDDIRRISNDLMPSILKEFGLIYAIESLMYNLQKYSNIEVVTDIDSEIDIKDKKKTIYIFRIIQEAVNNIIKHADASAINITMENNNNMICLNIKDNGVGFDLQKVGYGNGLFNIKERVRTINGEINIESVISEGTQIQIKIPTL